MYLVSHIPSKQTQYNPTHIEVIVGPGEGLIKASLTSIPGDRVAACASFAYIKSGKKKCMMTKMSVKFEKKKISLY